jgi:hypothetical protein
MEPEGSLLCSQHPDKGPYPEPDASNHTLPTYFCKIHSNIMLPFTLVSSDESLPYKSSDQMLYEFFISPMRTAWLSSNKLNTHFVRYFVVIICSSKNVS